MKCPMGTEIRVISVTGFSDPFPGVEEASQKEATAAQRLVDEAVEKLKKTHPSVNVSGDVLDGYVVEQIIHYCDQWPADLVMLGSHGRAGLTEFVLGSVSRSVLSLAGCAVRIVRPPERERESQGLNVLMALDPSQHCEFLVDHALKLPWPAGSRFRLLNVLASIDENTLFDPDIEFANLVERHLDSMIYSRKEWLCELTKKINDTFGADVAEKQILTGDPRKKILECAKDWPADIIMVGSHGRQGIEKLILGSVSEAVASHAPCSVEVTRVPAFRKQPVAARR